LEIRLKAHALQEHIARRNLSQNGFAMQASVSGGYLAQLLAGKKRPSGRVREKLMKASGLDFDALFRIIGKSDGDELEEEYASAIHSH